MAKSKLTPEKRKSIFAKIRMTKFEYLKLKEYSKKMNKTFSQMVREALNINQK